MPVEVELPQPPVRLFQDEACQRQSVLAKWEQTVTRNYLLMAGGLLLATAAALHFLGGSRPSGGDSARRDANPSESKPADATYNTGHELVDPLVPPIRIDGLPITALGHQDPHAVQLWDPESLVGRIAETADFTADSVAHFHAHGEEVCASGCAASRHPTKELTRDYFHELLKRYAIEPMDETSFALESLLYFGRQTAMLLEEEGDYPLDPIRSDFLRSELRKTHAKIEIRVVDEYGEVRTWLSPTRVPLDRRHEFDMQVNNVQPLETSGTVKRVGLYHLWNRL